MSETQNISFPNLPSGDFKMPNLGIMTDIVFKEIAPQINKYREALAQIHTVVERSISLEKQVEDLKAKLTDAQKYIRKLEKQTQTSTDGFNYKYDCTDFDKNTDPEEMANLLYELVLIKTPEDDYLINDQAAVTPVFIILQKSANLQNKGWIFCGSLSNLVLYWNNNVAARIEDKQRKDELTCNYDSVKADFNKQPWKNSSPGLWERKLQGGARHIKILKRAINIKYRIEKLFR